MIHWEDEGGLRLSRKLTILVSSTVYGIEELLDRTYTLLTSFGYEVWMSYKGTVPVKSNQTAFENCLQAVERCDLFLGIITTDYGSGQDQEDPKHQSITHQEILKAIELKKPRWILAHDHVVYARALLNIVGFKGVAGRQRLSILPSSTTKRPIAFRFLNEKAIGFRNSRPCRKDPFS
jgi:hypothetical protein